MVTDSLLTYGHWNLTLPICQPRSRLYSLQPIGIGTPQVESLTGYVARLAEAHCVQPGSLIAHEFTSLTSQPHGRSYLHQVSGCTEVLNSTGQMASEFVRVLENLTLRHDLQYLTLLLWAKVLPSKGLVRRTLAWCPICYEEWRSNRQIVYEPLLWKLSVISVCPRHQQKLLLLCPQCHRQLPTLKWHSQPGYCSRCHQWLGNAKATTIQIVDSTELEWQTWVAKNVGELIAHTSHLAEAPERETVARSLSICIAQTTEGNIAEFAHRLGMLKNAVWQWQSGVALPQLRILLKICQALRLSLLDFLFNPETLNTTSTIVATHQTYHPNTQSLKRELETHQLQQSLETALAEEPPSPMETVAQRLGFSSRSLRRRFPTLCSAISTRYLSYREKIRTAKVEQSCQEVRQVALKLYDEGIDPTRSYIARFLSKPAYFREPLVAATLEQVRQELGLEKPYIPKKPETISEA